MIIDSEQEQVKIYDAYYNKGYKKGFADGSLSVTEEIKGKVIDKFIEKFINRNRLKQMTKNECIKSLYDLADELKEESDD